VACVVLGVAARLFAPDDIPGVVLLGLAWLAAAVPAIWFLGLSSGERRELRVHLLPSSPPENAPV